MKKQKQLISVTLLVIILALVVGYFWFINRGKLTFGEIKASNCDSVPRENNLNPVEQKVEYRIRCTVKLLEAGADPKTVSNSLVKVDTGKRLQVYVRLKKANENIIAEIQSTYQLEVETWNQQSDVIQGWISYQNVEDLANDSLVAEIKLPGYGYTN